MNGLIAAIHMIGIHNVKRLAVKVLINQAIRVIRFAQLFDGRTFAFIIPHQE